MVSDIMLFRHKKEMHKSVKNVGDIKHAVENPIEEIPTMDLPMPRSMSMQAPAIYDRPLPETHAEEQYTPRMQPPRAYENPTVPTSDNYLPKQPTAEKHAPLFIKVDKYKDLLITVNELKLFTSSLKQVFSIMSEIDTLRADAINIMRANIQRMEKSISEMDNDLLRPHGMTMHGIKGIRTDTRNLEDSLGELQKQLASLRHELHGVS